MIVCRECGERQDDGTAFCGRCGVFLEWEGERIGPEESPEPEAPPKPALPARGRWVPTAELATAGAPAGGPDTAPATGPEPLRAEPESAEPAASVTARQPEEARQRPSSPAPRRIEAVPSGSLICGDCGTGNDPSRRFCLRCGTSLASARVVERPSWWRRLLFRERTYEAGTRRRPRKRVRLLLPITLLVVLAVILLATVGPLRPAVVGAFRDAQNMLLPPVQVRPAEVVASPSPPEHAPALGVDGANNTYWAAAPGEPVPWLRAGLGEPTDLVALGVTPGVSLQTPEFLAGPRPAALEVAVTTGAGVQVRRFELADNPGFIELPLEIADARLVQINVVGSRGSTPTEVTAITEVELFARR